ncbi:hypothetical protein BG004_008144 [Podila humilis]|nr:hypothetical protein BG004_008144 [Podila humilis]
MPRPNPEQLNRTVVTTGVTLREQENCRTAPKSNQSLRPHLQPMDPVNWLRAIVGTTTFIRTQEEAMPMLLEVSPPVRNLNNDKGCSHMLKPQRNSPGIRYCSQRTEETNRPTAASLHHPPGSHQKPPGGITPHTAPSRILSPTDSRAQGPQVPSACASPPSPTDPQSRTLSNPLSASTLSRDSRDQSNPNSLSPSQSSSSQSSSASTSTPTANTLPASTASASNHHHQQQQQQPQPAHVTSTSRQEISRVNLSTSTLFRTTNQVLQEHLTQTVAFLQRTFSPTYRVGNMYLESWSNGTQRRGLERLKTSLERGDAFTLMRSTAIQVKALWARGIAASRLRATESERERLSQDRAGRGSTEGTAEKKNDGDRDDGTNRNSGNGK